MVFTQRAEFGRDNTLCRLAWSVLPWSGRRCGSSSQKTVMSRNHACTCYHVVQSREMEIVSGPRRVACSVRSERACVRECACLCPHTAFVRTCVHGKRAGVGSHPGCCRGVLNIIPCQLLRVLMAHTHHVKSGCDRCVWRNSFA